MLVLSLQYCTVGQSLESRKDETVLQDGPQIYTGIQVDQKQLQQLLVNEAILHTITACFSVAIACIIVRDLHDPPHLS